MGRMPENKSNNTRTTIPKSVVMTMGISPGDILDWETRIVDGQWIATVKKA